MAQEVPRGDDPRERRRWSRVDVGGALSIKSSAGGKAMHVLDISLGGFRSASPAPLNPGECHVFKFPVNCEDTVALKARVVHCYPLAAGLGADHSIGWAWVDSATNAEHVPIDVVAVINYVASPAFEEDLEDAEGQGRRRGTVPR